jgi:hypothetical protein
VFAASFVQVASEHAVRWSCVVRSPYCDNLRCFFLQKVFADLVNRIQRSKSNFFLICSDAKFPIYHNRCSYVGI